MDRRNFLSYIPLIGMGSLLSFKSPSQKNPSSGISPQNERDYWIKTLTKIAEPVLDALSRDQLKNEMPVHFKEGHHTDRKQVTYLEAFGRTMTGIAPWLELGPANTGEGKKRKKFLDLAHRSMSNAVNPSANDFMNFTEGHQPLVDAAFLAHALLRSPKQLWGGLDQQTQNQLITALKSTRDITPYQNNWLLFSGIIEAALLKFTGEGDVMRMDYGLQLHMDWYLGDGIYGDGPGFRWDYYNSFVIQPMLIDILQTLLDADPSYQPMYDKVTKRAQRYAEIQERLISPEGTFPPIGRSLPYRFGAFQLLTQMALRDQLPEILHPAQVRCALTAVLKKMMEAPGTFTREGWLNIGFCGHQPDIAENYVSTGSLYLCTAGMLPLGLTPEDQFWEPVQKKWTAQKAWNGMDIPNDKAL